MSELATDAVSRSERLTDLREKYRSRLVGDRSQAAAVVDTLLQNPVLTTRRVASQHDMTIQGARNVIGRLEKKGIVLEVEGIRGRSKRWVSPEVLAVLQPDAERGSLGSLSEADDLAEVCQNPQLGGAAPTEPRAT